MREMIEIEFHGLTIDLDCDVDSDPGEAPSRDCPGQDGYVYATEIRHNGVVVEASEELQEAVDAHLLDLYEARAQDEGAP
jgi:hypothetical protein